MMGTLPFLRAFDGAPTLSVKFMPDRDARRGLIRAIRRSRRAARFAHALAVWRNDKAAEEVSVAALLHDIAEMLVWILAPRAAKRMQPCKAPTRHCAAKTLSKWYWDSNWRNY